VADARIDGLDRSRSSGRPSARLSDLLTIRSYQNHPVFPALTAMLAAVVFFFCRLEFFAHRDISRFIDLGRSFATPGRVPHGIAIVPGTGYDGEFYYRLALDPADLHRTAFGITFDTAFRLQRITYSALAWVFAGGREGLIPITLVVVNILGFGALGWLGGMVAKEAQRPAIYGLLIAGYFGFLFSLGRDLTEICAASFLLAGIVALRRSRPVLAGVLLAAAALSRETALAFAVAVGVVSVVEIARRRRSPGRKDAAWIIPGVVFFAWQIVGRTQYGVFPIRADAGDNLGPPFKAMFGAIGHFFVTLPNIHSFIWIGELFVLSAMAVIAGTQFRRAKARSWERLAWVIACVVAVCLAPGIWRGEADFRGFEDLYVLSMVLILGSRRNLKIPIVLVAIAWAVTFVHRSLFF
jgi:hypothetical protein